MNDGWPALRRGDTLAIIAPAGRFDLDSFAKGRALLSSHYRVRVRDDIAAQNGYLAGDDTRRAAELLDALQDPDVRGIITARGGYGATRLLASIESDARHALQSDPKLLVGFSDITALHALWARAGVGSLHASMVACVGTLAEPLQERWLRALRGEFTSRVTGLSILSGGTARGPLCGGNLAVLCALLGTRHMPELRGRILFLEDVQERPYRIDRMLTSMRDAGALSGILGIVLGLFRDCAPGPDGTGYETVLRERLSDLEVPIVAALPAGHVDDNLELPFGREVTLDADAGALHLS